MSHKDLSLSCRYTLGPSICQVLHGPHRDSEGSCRDGCITGWASYSPRIFHYADLQLHHLSWARSNLSSSQTFPNLSDPFFQFSATIIEHVTVGNTLVHISKEFGRRVLLVCLRMPTESRHFPSKTFWEKISKTTTKEHY